MGEHKKVSMMMRQQAMYSLDVGYGMRIYVVYSNDNEI